MRCVLHVCVVCNYVLIRVVIVGVHAFTWNVYLLFVLLVLLVVLLI